MQIYVSDLIVASSNVAKGFLMGRSGSDEAAFGVAVAQDPMMETKRDIEYRQQKIVGTERYDIKAIHPNAICVLGSYVA